MNVNPNGQRTMYLDAVLEAARAPRVMSSAISRLSDGVVKELFDALVADIDARMLAEKSARSQS